MALMAQRPAGGYADPTLVEKDVEDLNQHGLAKGTKLDEVSGNVLFCGVEETTEGPRPKILFCQIFINRSDMHIATV